MRAVRFIIAQLEWKQAFSIAHINGGNGRLPCERFRSASYPSEPQGNTNMRHRARVPTAARPAGKPDIRSTARR
jgi:hypothetical protein